MAQIGRPKSEEERIAIRNRDINIVKMDKKGYPLDYIASFYNLTKSRIVQIIKKNVKKNL